MSTRPYGKSRLNDRETERRMLEAAIALVHERGMSTGLESLSFEDVIRDAQVSRTSAYRRWPRREQFYGEVMLALARGTDLPTTAATMVGPTSELVERSGANFSDPQGHRNLVVELLRLSIDADFDAMRSSRPWKTFSTLIASHRGIADPALLTQVADALATVEQRAVELRARAYGQFSAALGYRLTPPLAGPDGFELMSQSTGSTMLGMLIKEPLQQDEEEPSRSLRALGSSELAVWRPATYAVTAMVLSFIEPDPGIEWTTQRADDLLATIRSYAPAAQ